MRQVRVTSGRLPGMEFPTPDEPKQAPVWENYVISQAAYASLRSIPSDAHALGVEVRGFQVVLIVQAPATSAATEEDMTDIVSALEALLGPDVAVSHRVDIKDQCRLSPFDGVAWYFAARP